MSAFELLGDMDDDGNVGNDDDKVEDKGSEVISILKQSLFYAMYLKFKNIFWKYLYMMHNFKTDTSVNFYNI